MDESTLSFLPVLKIFARLGEAARGTRGIHPGAKSRSLKLPPASG